MVNVDRLLIFMKVANEESFTLAAQKLKLSKSFVSEQVSKLESELGIPLFRRTTRSLALTQEGTDLLGEVRKLEDQLTQIEISISAKSKTVQGQLRVTATNEVTNFIISPALPRFRRLYPELKVQILSTDRILNLTNDKIDLAIRIGNAGTDRLIQKKIAEVSSGLFASPSFVANRLFATVSDLAKFDVFGFEGSSKVEMRSENESSIVKVANLIQIDSISGLKEFCIHSGGLCILPRSVCSDALANGSLINVLPTWSTKPAPIFFVFEKALSTSPRIRAFMNFYTAEFARQNL